MKFDTQLFCKPVTSHSFSLISKKNKKNKKYIVKLLKYSLSSNVNSLNYPNKMCRNTTLEK